MGGDWQTRSVVQTYSGVSLMSFRRSLVAGAAALLLVPSGLGAPAVSAKPDARKPKPAYLQVSVPDLMPGEVVSFVAKKPRVRAFTRLSVKQQRQTRLVLQRKVDGKWRRIEAKRLKRKKKVTFSYRVPAAASGREVFRTIGKLKGRKFRAGKVSRQVNTAPPQLTLAPVQLFTASAFNLSLAMAPVRPGRVLQAEIRRNGVWEAYGPAVPTGSAAATQVPLATEAAPAWYRVVTGEWHGLPGMSTEPVFAKPAG